MLIRRKDSVQQGAVVKPSLPGRIAGYTVSSHNLNLQQTMRVSNPSTFNCLGSLQNALYTFKSRERGGAARTRCGVGEEDTRDYILLVCLISYRTKVECHILFQTVARTGRGVGEAENPRLRGGRMTSPSICLYDCVWLKVLVLLIWCVLFFCVCCFMTSRSMQAATQEFTDNLGMQCNAV